VKTELIDAEPMEKPSPFSSIEVWAWTGVLLISFAASLVFPSALGTRARTYLPFLLASSVRLHDWLRVKVHFHHCIYIELFTWLVLGTVTFSFFVYDLDGGKI